MKGASCHNARTRKCSNEGLDCSRSTKPTFGFLRRTAMNTEIKGTTLPVLDVTLDAGDEVISTHGELSWMTSNVEMSQTANTGGAKGLMSGLKRMAGGGGLMMTRYRCSS